MTIEDNFVGRWLFDWKEWHQFPGGGIHLWWGSLIQLVVWRSWGLFLNPFRVRKERRAPPRYRKQRILSPKNSTFYMHRLSCKTRLQLKILWIRDKTSFFNIFFRFMRLEACHCIKYKKICGIEVWQRPHTMNIEPRSLIGRLQVTSSTLAICDHFGISVRLSMVGLSNHYYCKSCKSISMHFYPLWFWSRLHALRSILKQFHC